MTSAGSNTYSQYDGNGNLVLGGGRTLSWDANNRITQVSMGASTTSFVYGPDGDRIKKMTGGTVAKYPFGDDYEIAADGTVTKYFNAGFGVIAKKVGTTLYWLHTDRMGSSNATTDSGGAEVLRRSYRTYGELLGQTGTGTESLGYIGQRTDEETGLTYLHARYYDPVLGLFLSTDPAEADRNAYRYSFGDSVNFRDPTGLVPCWGDTFYHSDNGTLLDSATEKPCDEGELDFNAGINVYLHDHSIPIRPRPRVRSQICEAFPSLGFCSGNGAPEDGPPEPPAGCGSDQGFVAADVECEPPPIDKTCATEIIGVPCGTEPIFPDPSVVAEVCASVVSAKSQPVSLFSLGKFRSGRDWDLKSQKTGASARIGNVNYGAVMRAMGAPTDLILRGAGAYQWLQNLSSFGSIYAPQGGGPFWDSPWGNSPFGDDLTDQHQIEQGIWLVDSGTCR